MSSTCICTALSLGANALEEKRLWLPVKYHKYYLDLVEAAQAAEALENCTEVLSGSMDFDQSKPGHPIYRILCRRPDGLSYNEMVDGLSKETLTTVVPTPKILTPEELEQQRLEELRRQEEARKRRLIMLWGRCEGEFAKKTKFMKHMVMLTELPPEPSVYDEEGAQFVFDFDAKDISGTPLQYRVWCRASEESQNIKIKPRR